MFAVGLAMILRRVGYLLLVPWHCVERVAPLGRTGAVELLRPFPEPHNGSVVAAEVRALPKHLVLPDRDILVDRVATVAHREPQQRSGEQPLDALEIQGPTLIHHTVQHYNIFGIGQRLGWRVTGTFDITCYALGCAVNR